MALGLARQLAARSPSLHARFRALRRDVWFALGLRRLPWRVAVFQWRAWRLAGRLGDEFARSSSTMPRRLATLLALAGDGRHAVELGTAQGWTAISLALAHPGREVVSYDPYQRAETQRYLQLVPDAVRRRVTFVAAAAASGPRTGRPVDLLYLDTTHEREATIREYQTWRPVLRPGGWLVLDDYGHPDFPGVAQAADELGLRGEARDGFFLHRVPAPLGAAVGGT